MTPRLVACLVPAALAACSAVATPSRTLSYAEVQAVQPGLTATQVLEAYDDPANVARGSDGRVRTIEYAAQDARGGSARLVLEFDAREVLVRKRYDGAVVRP